MDAKPNPQDNKPKKKRVLLKIALAFILLAAAGGLFLYNNFNRLLSDALLKSFNSNIVSDVYELKFEKLHVDLFKGNINVLNVVMQPREKPLNSYPYINSSFILKTQRILLTNVQLMKLIKENNLALDQIEIIKPEIELTLEGKVNVLFPIKDVNNNQEQKSKKKFVESFLLKEFHLEDASFRVSNSFKERRFKIENFNITLNDIQISQQSGRDLFLYNKVDLLLGKFEGSMDKGPFKHISFSDYHLKIDSMNINKTLDTLIYKFHDLNTSINSLDIQTKDSVFHIQMKSFNLSYSGKSVEMNGIGFFPNMSFAKLQKNIRYGKTDFSAAVGKLNIVNLDFDSLIAVHKIFIDNILLDSVVASIYKDNTKEVDKSNIPKYFGQQIVAIPIPLNIKEVRVTNVNLTNFEKLKDSTVAEVHVNRGTVLAKNITNIFTGEDLTANIDAYLAGKVHFNVNLGFSYSTPKFSLKTVFGKFNLTDMNPVLQAYTPAKINKGVADKIEFYGTVNWTYSEGIMEFFYHDLDVDLQLHNKAGWKSSVGAFAANAYLPSGNPASEDLPPRIVRYRVDRKMNSGFINLIIKSALAGLKETVFMSKENRKAYKLEKKKLRNAK